MERMNFAVISLGFLGDTLLVEPLCRNIRNAFPESKIIFIANKVFEDIPKGFDCVDEIFSFDKTGIHKGFGGYLRFAKEFPYRNKIDYCIVTHEHERSLITAKLIGSKKIISKPIRRSLLNLFVNMKRNIVNSEIENSYKADYFTDFLLPLSNVEHLPVVYKRNDINDDEILKKYNLPEKYIVLSPTSKDLIKDWDYENVKGFMENSPLPVVLVGTDKANELAQKLDTDSIKYIDLTKKTTITELGAVIKHAQVCVSMDTGTFHFSYAQGAKTVGIFFSPKFAKMWFPKKAENVELLLGEKLETNNRIECTKDVTYKEVLSKVEKLTANEVLK